MLLQKFSEQPKALIIAQPWAGMIVGGEKVWEMRKSPVSYRGYFAVAEKGAGRLLGLANLHACNGPLSVEYLLENEQLHRGDRSAVLSPDFQYFYAWELSDVYRFESPISYGVKSGAVSWVNLSEEVAQQIVAAHGCPDASDIRPISEATTAAVTERKRAKVGARRAVAKTVFKTPAPTVVESVDGGKNSNLKGSATQTEDRYTGLMVPSARDGSVFHPETCSNKGRYQVGDKGNEKKFNDYFEALKYLEKMQTACWRRPNANGNWGGVKAVSWVKLEYP